MATPTPKYAKGPRPDNFARPGAPSTLMLRMTLGDMPLEDAFEVETSFAADTTLGSLIDATFPPDPREQRQIRRLLDHRTNPDLPDMYDALIELLDHWRKRRCDLRFFVNHGAEVTLDGRIDGWLAERGAAPRLLDLVMEQLPTPLDYAVHRGYAGDATALLRWLEETAVLYFLWQRPETARICTTENAALADVLQRLDGQGYVNIHDGEAEVTPGGEQHLEQLIAEAESYVDRYDLFSDVLVGAAAGSHRFGTGRGIDLRVPVYEAEGVDPLRAVFLLRIYDSSLEEAVGEDWKRAATDADFFREILAPVTDSEDIDPIVLDAVIDDGFAMMEQALADAP